MCACPMYVCLCAFVRACARACVRMCKCAGQVVTVFRRVDADGDGVLSQDEFVQGLQENRTLADWCQCFFC
jgi:hypothetical protein